MFRDLHVFQKKQFLFWSQNLTLTRVSCNLQNNLQFENKISFSFLNLLFFFLSKIYSIRAEFVRIAHSTCVNYVRGQYGIRTEIDRILYGFFRAKDVWILCRKRTKKSDSRKVSAQISLRFPCNFCTKFVLIFIVRD